MIETKQTDRLQLSMCSPKGFKGPRIRGVEWNAKELQRVESLKIAIQTLFGKIYNNNKFSKDRYDLTSQIKISVISILADIAEIEGMLKALI